MDQRGWADHGGVVSQAGRDAYYIDQRGVQRSFLAPLRPAAERAEFEPTIRGRDDLLAMLAGLLTGDVIGARVRVLHGLGGCGKTTVARELARRALEAGIPAWWIATTSAESVALGMQAVAVALGADPDRLRMGSVPEVVWEQLAAQIGPWLLIFDNADDPHRVLCPAGGSVTAGNGWLRPIGNAGLTVVTSRDGSSDTWGGHRLSWLETHPVVPLDVIEGGAVLSELAGPSAGAPSDAQSLSTRLGGLPLALRIAGSYLAETARIPARFADPGTVRTFADYHQALDKGGSLQLFPYGGGEITDDRARELIGHTWELSLDHLAARGLPDARPLLRLLSCFADAPIPYDLLLRPEILAEHAHWRAITGGRVWRLLQALAGLGLLDLREPDDLNVDHPGNHLALLHPLVRDSNARHPDVAGDAAGFPALAVRLMATATDDIGPPEDPARWLAWQNLTPHAAHLLRQTSAAAERTSEQTTAQVCRAAMLAGRYLHNRGLYGPAKVEYGAVLDVARRLLGEEHPETLRCRHNHAILLQDRGEPGIAEAEFRAVLAIRRRLLGDEHADTLDTRRNLAAVLHQQGDLRAAEAEFRAVLPAQRRVLGEDHNDPLITQHVLAILLRDRGELDEAEAEFRAVLAISRRVFGEEHPNTLLPRNSLAVLLRDRGELDEAEAEFRAVLAISRQVLGEEHRISLIIRHSLAVLLQQRGDLDKAEAEFRAVLAISQRVLGEEHPDTVAAQHAIAVLTQIQGQLGSM
ncbi:tetratricopeptide repeat protein [Micromonospora sp. NPDC005806]|uniref:tetratricopeptide repeat protein n=1 Tax=Micromonospora sp. NPDC005806 TaxID=3364234 RepID=UPI0036955934